MRQNADTAGSLRRCGDRLADPDPLVGARHVVRVLAGREQLAEDLLEDAEVVDLAAGDRGERLVEEHHALLGPVGVDEARAEVGERHELQIGVAEPAGHLERLAEVLLLAGAVALEHAEVERHPPALGRLARLAEQRLRPGEPAARHRPVADDRAVHVGERPGDADRADLVAGVAMGGVRPLPAAIASGKSSSR